MYPCPIELLPNNGVCPESFPVLKDGCCTKNIKTSIYNSKYIFKSNINYISKPYDFSPFQINAMILYSHNGDRAMSNYTTNDFIVDEITANYIYQHAFKFSFLAYTGDYQSLMDKFYKLLNSCFVVPCDEHILYNTIFILMIR